jgi:hypothetical protein
MPDFPMDTIKSVAARLALVTLGILVSLLFAEFLLRVTRLGKADFYTYDSTRGWTLKPNASGWERGETNTYLRVNRYGLRGPEISLQRPKDTLRIAVLGDSFTEAQQVPEEQTFSAVMQRELSKCPIVAAASNTSANGQSSTGFNAVEVLNFGCDGYGTAQELLTLQTQVWRFSPQVVVLAVFTGNDIRNNSAVLEGDKCRPFFVLDGERLIRGGPFDADLQFRTSCMMRFESRHFQVLNMLGHARSVLRSRIRARHVNAAVGPAPEVRGEVRGQELGLNNIIYKEPVDQVWRDAWKITEEEVEMVHREAAAQGALFLALTLSNGIQVEPDPAVRQNYAKWLGVRDLLYPDHRLKVLAERDGFQLLNLAPALQAYAEQHRVFLHGFRNLRSEGHWNAEGHRAAGELISKKLCELLQTLPKPAAAVP